MSRSRIVVSQTDPHRAAPGAVGPLPVGLVRWPSGGRVSVIVKATLSFAGTAAVQTAQVAAEQLPLSIGEKREKRGARDDELHYPSDFCRWRPWTDVYLVGHAYAMRAEERIDCKLVIDGDERSFCVRGSPREAMPLSHGFLRGPDGEVRVDPTAPHGPLPAEDEFELEGHDGPIAVDDDDRYFSSPQKPKKEPPPPTASPDDNMGSILDEIRRGGTSYAGELLRFGEPGPESLIELYGLSREATRRVVQLPGVEPLVIAETEWDTVVMDMRCDTVWIDTDAEQIVLVWRGQLPTFRDEGRDISKLIVSLEAVRDLREPPELFQDLAKGTVGYAVEEQDVREPTELDEIERAELQMEQLAAMEATPRPDIGIAEYARISAELAEQREPRADVLKRHKLTEDRWLNEERAWLMMMATAALDGDTSYAERYGELFVQAQDELASPTETDKSLEEYADLKLALEREPAGEVLSRHQLTEPEWRRLDRKWMKRRLGSPDVRKAYNARVRRLRALESGKSGGEETES
jgi:hypothetical protein